MNGTMLATVATGAPKLLESYLETDKYNRELEKYNLSMAAYKQLQDALNSSLSNVDELYNQLNKRYGHLTATAPGKDMIKYMVRSGNAKDAINLLGDWQKNAEDELNRPERKKIIENLGKVLDLMGVGPITREAVATEIVKIPEYKEYFAKEPEEATKVAERLYGPYPTRPEYEKAKRARAPKEPKSILPTIELFIDKSNNQFIQSETEEEKGKWQDEMNAWQEVSKELMRLGRTENTKENMDFAFGLKNKLLEMRRGRGVKIFRQERAKEAKEMIEPILKDPTLKRRAREALFGKRGTIKQLENIIRASDFESIEDIYDVLDEEVPQEYYDLIVEEPIAVPPIKEPPVITPPKRRRGVMSEEEIRRRMGLR